MNMKTALVVITLLLANVNTSSAQRELTVNDLAVYKSPGTATLISVLITGGGHMYAGETGKGLGLLLGSAGAIGIGAALSTSETSCYGYVCTTETNLGPLYIGSALAFGLWIYGVADAGEAARRSNVANGITDRFNLSVQPQVLDGKLNAGIKLSISL